MTPNTITAGSTAIPSAVTELPPKPNVSPLTTEHQAPQAGAATAAPTPSATPTNAPDAKRTAIKDKDGTANLPAAKTAAKTVTYDELAKAVDELNASYKSLRRTGLQFSVDDKAEELVVKVMDVDKDEVIRQIPPEDLLELAAFIKEQAAQQKDKNPWTALTERNQAHKIPTEGWLVDDKA